MIRTATALAWVLLTAGIADAQIVDGNVEHRAASASLARDMDAVAGSRASVWAAYRVPVANGFGRMCDDRWNNGRIHLAPPAAVVVLARFESRQVMRLRIATDDCEVDTGGQTVVWLDNVTPAESVAWLTTLIESQAQTANAQSRVVDPAVMALVWHDSNVAMSRVIELARTSARPRTRSQALFWLSQRAIARSIDTIWQAVDQDPDAAVRAKAVFALSQLPRDEGVPLLIQLAGTHRDREVRRKAMFWLGQSGDPRATAFFEEVLR